MESLSGRLLVASSSLRDPNFFRAVVLVIRHNEEGAFGLVLNRPTNATIGQVWARIKESPCVSEGPVHFGGPVEGPLMAIHSDPAAAELNVFADVYFTADLDNIERLVASDEGPIRFYVGYAGWGAGQLERELREGSWATPEATPDHVFASDADLWHAVTRALSATTLLSVLGIKRIPEDPSVN
jgi:putative transcriptional regulator